jgi:hypothetical protein
MTCKRAGLVTLGLLLVALAAPAAGQGPPMPTPGPEHQVLKEEAGTWDAVVEVFGVPGEPKSKGVETSTIGCGGLCLITDFKGETLPGQVFHGHGTATYDALKKKYVGSWTDSMSSGLGISESTWDPATRTMTGTMESPNSMTGTVVKMRTSTVFKDGTRVLTMYAPGPDGKEVMAVRITYTRRP